MTNQNPGADNQQNKLIISAADLTSDSVSARVEQMREAQKVALVREIGIPTTSSTGSAAAVFTMLAAGLVGGLIAFAAQRFLFNVVGIFDGDYQTTANNVTFTFILTASIGIVIALSEPLFSGNFRKFGISAAIAVPLAIGLGLLIGFIASAYYSNAMEAVYVRANANAYALDWNDIQFWDYVSSRTHFPRGIAWMFVGIAAGLTAGVPSKSGKKIGLGIGGGALGGFLGGFLFDYINGEALAQAAGILLLGALIGLAVALLEQAAKSRWIEILAGGMAGKQFILYKSEITVGSSPRADITLIKDPAISELAARITVRGNQASIESLDQNCPIYVDGRLVVRQPLLDSSRISVGNTEIRFRERSSQGQVPGSISR
jgi:hypothetical protein